jgi:hypothetical protein
VLRGINLLSDLKVKPQVGIAYLCLAEVYAQAQDTQKALKSLKTAEAIFKETGMEYWLLRAQQFLKIMGA